MSAIEISKPPTDLTHEFEVIFTDSLKEFLIQICRHFGDSIDKLFFDRTKRRLFLENREISHPNESLEDLACYIENELSEKHQKSVGESIWRIDNLPHRLKNRHLDLGDVSPSDSIRFQDALKMDPLKVQGIQVDFDDGHCPTWRNQITGWFNIYQATHQDVSQQGHPLNNSPILMLRPRAWNMTEEAIMVDGKKYPGAIIDFAIIMFHNGKILAQSGQDPDDRIGPFFYLSKIESFDEAKLWAQIFDWSEQELCLQHGTIKACILIENILASFQMEEILFEIREFGIGLNCGLWDYSASIINKFGKRGNFVIPDRKKYVNMEREFLKNYLRKVVQICHKHGALATGGMAANVMSSSDDSSGTIELVLQAKSKEIQQGVDGFLIYDPHLVDPMHQLWNQLKTPQPESWNISGTSLLMIPKGGATFEGLKHNIEVGILFIKSWIVDGKGSFHLKGFVEDSATAEISRSQVWQWIRHRVKLENDDRVISRSLVSEMVDQFVSNSPDCFESGQIFLEIVTAREFPEFVTTYLSIQHEFIKKFF